MKELQNKWSLFKVASMFKDPSHLPQYFQRKGIYYGYIILAVGTLGVVMSIPGQTMGVSVYTEYLIEALGMSRSQLSFAYLLGTISSSFLLPYAGRVLDKLGPRFMAVLATTCLGLSLLYISFTPIVSEAFVSLTGLDKSTLSFIIIFFGFLGVRHFGQGQLTMCSRTMMGQWFEKKRGTMLGISGLFVAFGFGLAPLTLTQLIKAMSWQNSLYLLASLCFGVGVVAYLFFRKSPESCGLKIDGGFSDPNSDEEKEEALRLSTQDFTAAQAKRTFTFWVYNLAMVGQATFVTAITFHMSFIGKLNGMSSEKAYSIFLYIAIISTLADLVGGYLSDRIPLKYLLATMQGGLTLALIGITYYHSNIGMMITALGFGISGGLFAQLSGSAWPKLFGRTHLGSIAGMSMSWLVMGSSLGPYMLSLGGETVEGVNTVLYLFALFPLFVAVASFFANPPKKGV